MNSRFVLSAIFCVAFGAVLAADDAVDLHKKGIASLKESQTNPAALVMAARFFAKASAAFEASGQNALAVDANSFLYYCKKKMTLADIDAFLKGEDAVVSERLNKIESKPVGAFEAQAWLDRADVFAKGHPDEEFLVMVRYFEVAERFKDSDAGRTAMSRSLEAMQKFIASNKNAAANRAGPASKPNEKPITVNLMPFIDTSKDALKGRWVLNGNQMFSDKSGVLQIPYKPPEEYDFKMVFMRTDGKEAVAQICSKGDHYFTWVMDGYGGTVSGLDRINGKSFNDNDTALKASLLVNNKWHTSIVQVRNTGVTVLLDGRPMVKLKTNYENLTLHPGWKLRPDGGLGLMTAHGVPVTYSKLELIEITGKGEKMR